MNNITIFHGSSVEIKKPLKNKGKKFNDYGQGFYCTKHKESAAQWACKFQEDGIVNEYELDTSDLNILNLDSNYNILNWLAILVGNREFTSDEAIRNAEFIKDNYGIEYRKYDVIIGYRADDAYFRFVRDFLTNSTGLNTLDESMYLGELGLQVFIQSDLAFSKLEFIKSYEVDGEEHFIQSILNIEKANQRYSVLKKENEQTDLYIRDLKRGDLDEKSIPKIKIR